MAIKLRKLTMLSILFSLGLGIGLSSGEVNTLSTPTKEAVSYASSDDLNDHDTNHSSDYNWVSLEQSDFNSGDYSSGALTGGATESEMKYFYLNSDIKLSSSDIEISYYVTLCLNGKTLEGTGDDSVIIASSSAYFNLCDCSGSDSGTVKGVNNSFGAVYIANSSTTFNMYGGTLSDNTAVYGGGVYVRRGSFNMYGGTISGNTATAYAGGVYLYDATFNMYGGTISGNTGTAYGGGVYVDFATFNMYGGTIVDNTTTGNGSGAYIHSGSFNMYGGYFDNNLFNGGTLSIKGGYFSETAYNSIENYIDSDYIGVDISTFGTEFDENYVEGYEYAVYTKSTSTYSVNDITVETYGTKYEPTISGGSVTGVAYTWIDGDDTIVGLPTNISEYTVTAHILYTTTEEYLTTNYYATAEFKVTISNKGQAVINADASQSKTYDGEVASVDYTVIVGDTDITSDATVTETWYDEDGESISSAPTEVGTYKVTLTVVGTDNYDGTSVDVTYTITENTSSSTPSDEEDGTDNTSDGGTTTSTDSTGLSAGAIAGIVIASVFVVGLIAFLVYFFVFRKKKAKKEEKKSSKKTKK